MTTFTLKDYIDNLTLKDKREVLDMLEELERLKKKRRLSRFRLQG